MATLITISPVTALEPSVRALCAEGAVEGFGFPTRLLADWDSGHNRFDRPGEVLLGAYVDGNLAGVGGLNRDPYDSANRWGRIRHLYVGRAYRGRGIGSALLGALMEAAAGVFDAVRLRTDTAEAHAFYISRGFVAVDQMWGTHIAEVAPGGDRVHGGA